MLGLDNIPEENTPNTSPLIESLRGTINDLHSEVSHLRKELGDREQLNYEILQQIEKLNPYLSVYKPKRGRPKVTSCIEAVIQFGDWHIGEMTDPAMTGGFGEYNYKIAQKRAFYITESMMKWAELHRSSYRLYDCHILDLGDNISGDIHQELQVTNEFPVPQQVIKSAYLKAEVYRRIAAHFRKVTVEFVSVDNHSRRTRKPQAKQAGQNSENYLVGFITQTMLQNIKNITFNLHLSHQISILISGRRYLCEHGNTVRGWAGFPWYGADRKVAKEAKRTMKGEGFDKLVLQHFHTPVHTQYFMVGGSLSGTTEFDHQQGRHAAPAQCAWMVHPKHGEFNWCAFKA